MRRQLVPVVVWSGYVWIESGSEHRAVRACIDEDGNERFEIDRGPDALWRPAWIEITAFEVLHALVEKMPQDFRRAQRAALGVEG